MTQCVKNPPAMQETQEKWVQFPGREDPLEEEVATHSRILARESHGQRALVGHSPRGHRELGRTQHQRNSSLHMCLKQNFKPPNLHPK